MPLQNRVTPLGELVAEPGRGLVYGNRGCLHDDRGRIRRRYAGRRWIACRLRFRGWHREPLLQPGRFTELFFLDEATAFAAGHRPCALCRREDYVRFGEIWRVAPSRRGRRRRDRRAAPRRADRRGHPRATPPRRRARRASRRRVRPSRRRAVPRARCRAAAMDERRATRARLARRRASQDHAHHPAVARRGAPSGLAPARPVVPPHGVAEPSRQWLTDSARRRTTPHRLWNLDDEAVHGVWFVVGRSG